MNGEPFSTRLRALRKRAGLTQEQLAELSGLSANAISSLERGSRRSPYPQTVKVIAAALGLDAAERVELEGSVAPRGFTLRLPSMPWPVRGRDDEIAHAVAQLSSRATRLLTLTGPGGVGKTRMALAVAEQLVEPFPEGVVMVPLASLTDASSVVQAIAETLGLNELGSQPIEDMLRSYLQSRRLLLVLDNFEHLAEAAASVAGLLESAPGLAVLATSRSPLRVRAEQIVVVEGLTPAVARELFIERAGQAAVSIAETDVAAINEICRRLDYLPLAIELAAARTRTLPPASLLDRLDAALFTAGSGLRDLPDRQRTLYDTVAWSNDLLTPENQNLFSRLGVFSGGWSIDAAAAVSGIDEPAVLDLHAALIDSSLVERDRLAPRFRMLETIRSFALEQQRTSGAEIVSRDRHAAYYQQRGATALDEIWSSGQLEKLNELDVEQHNLRSAWLHLLRAGRISELADLCVGLMSWWLIRCRLTDGEAWTSEALASPACTPADRAKIQLAAGLVLYPRGRLDEAADRFAESYRLARETGDRQVLAWGQACWSNLEAYRGQLTKALELAAGAEEAALGPNDQAALLAKLGRAHVAIGLGELDEAGALLADIQDRARQQGLLWTMGVAAGTHGRVALLLGKPAEAEAMLQESVRLFDQVDDRWGMMHSLVHLADAAAQLPDSRRAATLYGVTDQLMERTGVSIFPAWQELSDHCQAQAITATGLETFLDLRLKGRHLAWHEAIDLALRRE